ncbi:MAG TPA: PEP-CTERM sorting domain-containing protein [Burkholderiaceae bacterium]|nr:PEP-CTERM sorting domain-containing protein [Burkholderiaceae bacterium]
MKGNWLIRALAASLLFFAAQAQALLLTPAGTTCTSNINSNFNETQVEAWVLSCFGRTLDLSLLYKADVSDDGPPSESGPYAGSYQTTFSNTASDPSNALIDYISGLAIVCPECFLVVKDGNQTPAQYLFDIGSWNGTDDLSLSGFWPDQGAISNVAIWGAPARQVSAPGTMALFGLALAGLGFVLRRKAT